MSNSKKSLEQRIWDELKACKSHMERVAVIQKYDLDSVYKQSMISRDGNFEEVLQIRYAAKQVTRSELTEAGDQLKKMRF